MTTEFERCRRQVCGKEVTITSWQDSESGRWTAAAPSYAHVFRDSGAIPHGGSRDEVVGQMVRLLADYLSPRPKPANA